MTMHLLLAVVAAMSLSADRLLPFPPDSTGWGVGAWVLRPPGPLFVGESIEQMTVSVVLSNYAPADRSHPSLQSAQRSGDLRIAIIKPDGTPLRSHAGPYFQPRIGVPRPELKSRRSAFAFFRFSDFGYGQLLAPGEYKIDVLVQVTPKMAARSQPIMLKVVDIPPVDVLASRPVPLSGVDTVRPVAEHPTASVQQVQYGGRVHLVYRRYVGPKYGGGIDHTSRLAELPKQAEFQVAGKYGLGERLSVAYRHPVAGWTILTVNSVDGSVERRERRDD